MEEVNPLRLIRHSLGWSLDRTARISQLSRQLIINNEAAQYTVPSPALIEFYTEYYDEHHITAKEMKEGYLEYQHTVRVGNYGHLTTLYTQPPLDTAGLITKHPVGHWCDISGVSVTSLAKSFCFHQSLLDRLMNKPNLMKSLPKQLVGALLESGYSEALLSEVERDFKSFKGHINSTQVKVS